jgi:hypothetical protein
VKYKIKVSNYVRKFVKPQVPELFVDDLLWSFIGDGKQVVAQQVPTLKNELPKRPAH